MTQTILVQGHYQQDDIPDRGAIIVDPDSKTVKIGDGTTPGGVALSGGGGGGGGATTFLGLTDTPTEFTGQAGKFIKVNAGGTALEFDTVGGITDIVQDTTPQLGGNLDAQAFDITTTGKILYANVYSTEGDLPNATTYHGMFAHVHGTGAGYFAHAGNWIKLANYTDLSPYQTVGTLGTNIDLHLNQGSAGNNQVLSWDGADYAWVNQSGGGGGLNNVVEDTTPELGGDLDTNGKDILLLNNRIKYNSAGGSMLDFTVTQYSVGNNTVLSSVGSINLFLDSASADVSGDTAFRIFDTTDPDGAVTEANNIFKIADTGDVSIKGKLQFPDGGASSNYAGFGNADDLKIFHNGNHSIVRETGTGNLYLQSNDNVILSKDSDTEIMVKGIADGAVELYHDNVKKFETTANGVSIVDDAHVEGATPYITIRRTDNANVPLIRFQGSAGANGATIGMDGTGGTVNDLIISAYGNVERIRTGVAGSQITGDLAVTGSIKMAVQAGDPSTEANYAHVYVKDDASSAEVFVQDEAGNVTKLSPHNQLGNWEYYSRNVKTGKVVRIDMEEMIKDIEQLTGKKYIKEE